MRPTLTMLSLLLLATAPAYADSSLLGELHARYDHSIDGAKTKLACKGAWTTSTAQAPAAEVTTLTCATAKYTQIMAIKNAVFAVSEALVDHGTDAAANKAYKGGKSELAAAKCTTVTDRGQMVILKCPQNFAVILMFNWNSADDTNTTTAMGGPADAMLPVFGLKP